MADKQVMIDIEDERMGKIADVLKNKTCKKILSLLSEKDELSESDIASEINVPLNTVDYNMKKLLKSGLVEECKKFFWSVKGKKIKTFRIAQKKIVISPRKIIGGILPAALISAVIAYGIKVMTGTETLVNKGIEQGGAELIAREADSAISFAAEPATDSVLYMGEGIISCAQSIPNYWAWFLIGSLTALLIVVLWQWKRRFGLKGGSGK